MKVKITGHSEQSKVARWWYANRIGEVFGVIEDEVKPEYYLTEDAGSEYQRHIKKVDCEVIE